MEGSRMRTLLGAGLILLGGLFLLRALAAPVALVWAPSPIAWQADQQRMQIELQHAKQEAQRELERARLDAQRALSEAQTNADVAEIPPIPPMPELPPVPPLPPLPTMPPATPLFHLGAWLNPPLVLVALLALLLWRRSRREHAPEQA